MPKQLQQATPLESQRAAQQEMQRGSRLESQRESRLESQRESRLEPQRESRQETQQEMRRMRMKFIVSAVCTLLLLLLTLAPMILGSPLPIPGLVDPVASTAIFALAELILVLPVIGVGYRCFTEGFGALVRRSPNSDSLVALGAAAALLLSLYQVVLVVLEAFGGGGDAIGGGADTLAHAARYFGVAAVFITLALLGKLLDSIANNRTRLPLNHLASILARYLIPIVCAFALVAGIVGYLAMTLGGFALPPGMSPVEFALLVVLSVLIIACPCALGLATPIVLLMNTGAYAELGILIKNGGALEVAHTIDTVVLSKTGTITEGRPRVTDIIPVAASRIEDALHIDDDAFWDAEWERRPQETTGEATTSEAVIRWTVGGEVRKLDLDHALFELVGDNDAMTRIVGDQKNRVLTFAATAERGSDHPIGQAIVDEAAGRALTLGSIQSFESLPGRGIAASIDGQLVLVGNHRFMEENAIAMRQLESMAASLATQGKTPLYLAVDGSVMGIITVADRIKDSSRVAIKQLQALGIEVILLTGDNALAAAAIATELGITELYAEVVPEEKAALIAGFQDQGHTVAMVGDGVNDARALGRADLGVAVGYNTGFADGNAAAGSVNDGSADVENADVESADVESAGIGSSAGVGNDTLDSADVVLINSDLRDVPHVLELSRRTQRNIKQNLFWASCYNLVGIPLAAGLLYLFGSPLLSPLVALSCMGLSTASVVLNTLRLKRSKNK